CAMSSFRKSSLPSEPCPPARLARADEGSAAAAAAGFGFVRGATIFVFLSTDQIQSPARSTFGFAVGRFAAVRSSKHPCFVRISDMSKTDAALADLQDRHRRYGQADGFERVNERGALGVGALNGRSIVHRENDL